MCEMKTALILYPHQLFESRHLPAVDTVFMVEDPLYFGLDQEFPNNFHKQKLILHRASMRRYVDEVLWPGGYNVEYIDYSKLPSSEGIFDSLGSFEHVYAFDPIDDVLSRRLQTARREGDDMPSLEFLTSPNFYLKYDEIKQFFADKTKHQFADFYQWQRERFNVMIGPDYRPLGGKWSFDNEKPKKLTVGQVLPSFEVFGDNKFVKEGIELVEKYLPDNPGSTDFIWPTNHKEAATWLEDFVEHRLDHFAIHQTVIDSQATWIYHSALSSSLNIGLLSPQQVVASALRRHARKPLELASLEAFIQKVLGWREYIRGVYINQGDDLRTSNIFKQQRRLTGDWYKGTLGLPPYDDMIKKIHLHAYAHPSERLQIAGSLMLMCEIHPDDAYAWYMSLFIDAYDWVSVPNVYGISQYANGSSMIDKLQMVTSDEILAISNYQYGDWADTWDGLYWRFVEKHREHLAKNSHTATLVVALDKLNVDRKRIINYRAEDFLSKSTSAR